MPDRITVKLKSPVQFGDKLITELKIREPVAKDLYDLPAEPVMRDMCKLLGRLSGEFDAVIEQLKIPDLLESLEIVQSFFPGGLAIGGMPST